MKHNQSSTILSAGMPRSGSTLVYNLIRLTMAEVLGGEYSYRTGWVDDLQEFKPADYTLLKIHDFDPQLALNASLIVYSYRDVREVIASMQRKFETQPALRMADTYIEQYQLWSRVADIKIRYEALDKALQFNLVNKITDHLQIGSADPAKILRLLDQLPPAVPSVGSTYDAVTLYHPGHITDGGISNWKEQLEPDLIASIEAKHHDWLKSLGYELLT